MKVQTIFRALALLLTASLLTACGGGTGGSGSGPAVAMGVMTKGSVIVNGVHFDDTSASIRIATELATGQSRLAKNSSDSTRPIIS